MKILILGGDGYLGWPTAMHFAAQGHDVSVVDNYLRRHACTELDVGMLYPVPNLYQRSKVFEKHTGKKIDVIIGDLADPNIMRGLFSKEEKPDAVVHYAEQPSAPYSLANYILADHTLINNLRVTNNLIWAVKEFAPECHIIKLGTMGEYGTPNIDIEEGWLDITHKGRSDRFLFPRQASSLYHTTKIMDTDLLWFAVRTWGLKVTDLMQGPVYGINTPHTQLDEDLKTIFNYDEIFGTVINRFIVQSVSGHPLTVYGKGGQTRGYLNINDTIQFIEVAIHKPANIGELRIFNQITETFSVLELAELIQRVGNARGYSIEIKNIENPRKEAEEHYYNPTYQGLRNLGAEPQKLTDEVLHGIFETVEKYIANVRYDVIFRGIKWN